eukprot:2668188-Lingulodinium_polyedra.AAC.1
MAWRAADIAAWCRLVQALAAVGTAARSVPARSCRWLLGLGCPGGLPAPPPAGGICMHVHPRAPRSQG